ncbi:uncharacterized protein LOC121368305 isoform X2 [Gigantopelta aegis]|nr:uncharacterized protein LOC121368305 isoform X2 [Gigantopelta aegis]
MRRFEIEARRHQMEEADSDLNIPDTFFGIECPPYEDPPPPYSSPKPTPRILPREAPPPYEEVNHTQNSTPAGVGNGDGGRIPDRSNNNHNHNRTHDVVRNQGTEVSRECNNQQAICSRSVMSEICQLIHDHHQTRNARTNGIPLEQEQPQRQSPASSTECTPSRRAWNSLDSSQSTQKATQNECLGNFCESVESLHGCGCLSEQTLLKQSYGPENSNNQQDGRGLGRQSGQCGVDQVLGCACTQSPPDRELRTPASSGSVASENREHGCVPISNMHKYSSLPSSSRNIAVDQRSDSVPNVGENEKTLTNHNTKYPILPKPLSCRPDKRSEPGNHSQSCGPLRSSLPRMVNQEEISQSLPLVLPVSADRIMACDRSTALVEEGPGRVETQEMHKLTDSEHHTLRNIRLLNLWCDPNSRPESPGSPSSTLEKNIIRSHSVNSEISLISVCSETGEKRASRNAAKVLESDSQYPEIPVSAHALRLTLESDAVRGLEREATPQKSGFHNVSDNGNCKSPAVSNDHHNSTVLNPTELNRDHFESAARDEKLKKLRLNAIKENGIEMTSYVKPSEESHSTNEVTQPQNKQPEPSKHKTKTKKKEKQNRHSTGGIITQKPKRPPLAAVHLGSAKMTDAAAETATLSNMKTCAIQVKPAVDPAKKKPNKSVGGSFKQYGFIDDPSHFQSQPVVKDDQKMDFVRQSPRDGRHVTKDPEHRSPIVASKLGAKRHLTSADKSSYSPSPTRHKTSRPRSMIHATKDASPATEHLNQYLVTSQNIPRRKLQQSSRSKKRQSYPVSQNVQPAMDVSSSFVSTPHSVVAAEDRIANKAETISSSLSNGAVVQTLAKQQVEHDSTSNNPIGLITVRNGPLSSYV